MTLPSGVRVRGRPLGAEVSPADFTLVLTHGTMPVWSYRRIQWPEFWIPRDRLDALDALHEGYRRAQDGERVEAVCRAGRGRTGAALAALAILDGVPVDQAVRWTRANFHPRAVETLWQRRWLRHVA